MIIEESKDRYIRVLEYKYFKVCMLMEVSAFSLLILLTLDLDWKAQEWGSH